MRGRRLGLSANRAATFGLALVLAVALSACSSNGADEAAETTLEPTTVAPTSVTTAVVRTAVPGFGEVSIRLSSGPELCALLARTQAQRARGLMGRTDLAGHVGMLFLYDADHGSAFHMTNTPMPLSIAWFDGSGRFISAQDMTPCLDQPTCPRYAATRPYRYALEVPQGGLVGIGAVPGSVLSVGGPC